MIYLKARDVDPVLAKKPDPGICTSNEERFLNMNILDKIRIQGSRVYIGRLTPVWK